MSTCDNGQTYLDDYLVIDPDLHILPFITTGSILLDLNPCSFASLVGCFELGLTLPDARHTVRATFFVDASALPQDFVRYDCDMGVTAGRTSNPESRESECIAGDGQRGIRAEFVQCSQETRGNKAVSTVCTMISPGVPHRRVRGARGSPAIPRGGPKLIPNWSPRPNLVKGSNKP